MHKFACYPGDGAAPCDLTGAYLVGADGVPVRGECRVDDGTIVCETRSTDPLGLSLLWPVRGGGLLHLETTRLPARGEPYNLHVELLRRHLLRISVKCEEWGLFDYPGMEEITRLVDRARSGFVEALKLADEPARAARCADEALGVACQASTRMCEFHANVFLKRRQGSGGFSRPYMGVALPSNLGKVKLPEALTKVFDFVRVPFTWREIQPKEQGSDFDATDRAVRAALKAGLSVRGGPLLNFGLRSVPDWLYLWENDYEAIADFARQHIRATVGRYAGKVGHWIAASGLHADAVFPLTFEQIMDLTRTAATATKQADPRAGVTIDVVQPWGEYYARNQQTIPPMLYAEMLVQSGIPFDALGLQLIFGIDGDAFHLRDPLQISSLIDRLANLGKPLQITAVSVPSRSGERGGEAWTAASQAEWFTRFARIALSKPYVESVCHYGLTDTAAYGVPGGGVLRDDLAPTPLLKAIAALRKTLAGKE